MKKVIVDDNRVVSDGKTLYHIQNSEICTDGEPYDLFVFLDHEPTEDDLKKAWIASNGNEDKDGLEEFLETSKWFSVWVENI